MRNNSFIQVFGWLMLALCGFSAVIVLFTAVLMYLIAGEEPLPVVGDHSGATQLLFRYLELFILSLVGYFAAGFVASLGLIRGDQPWARKLWIALLLVEIGWALLIIALEIFYPDPPSSAPAPGSFFPSFSTLALFSVVTFGTMSIAVSAWLIHRLRTGLSAPRSSAPASWVTNSLRRRDRVHREDEMSSTPKQALIGATGAVAASTALLPFVTGYGTVLYQAVAFMSWAIVAKVASSRFADQYDAIVWVVAVVVNGLFFFLPAWIAYAMTRRSWPRVGVAILIAWCFFYLASLFYLFPASDGP